MERKKQQSRALSAYLVASTRQGDAKACAQLAQLASPRLLTHASRLLGDPEQARDIVQSAWEDILKGLPKLRDDHAFLPWALQITTRKVARLIRKRQQDRQMSQGYAAEAETLVDDHAGLGSDAAAVRSAVMSLGPDHRATIALFYLEDLSVAEVAAALDVPIGTIKTRLMHARAKLRSLLEGQKP